MTDEFYSILAHFCIEMIWNFWKSSSYTPDSIVSYETVSGVVTQHFSVA